MKILDFIHASALKAGIHSDNAELKTFLATPITLETVIPEQVVRAMNGLMNLEGAKNNPEVGKHFKKLNLSPIDEKFIDLAQSLELESGDVDALKGEMNTYLKSDMLKEKLSDKMKKLKDAKKEGDPERVQTLNAEISLLRQTLKDRDSEMTRIKEQAQKRVNDYIEKQEIAAAFSEYQWSDLYSPDIRSILASTKLAQKLAALNGKYVVEGEKLKLVRADNPGMELYDDKQNPVTLKSIAGEVMSENKFLKVAPTPSTQTHAGTVIPPGTPPVTNTKVPSQVRQHLQNSDAELGINP